MRYFKLLDDVHVPGRWHIGKIVVDDGWRPDFSLGTPVQGRVSAEVSRQGRPLEFCETSFGDPVATHRLGAVIAAVAGNDLQRVHLHLRGYDGFEVLNSLRVIKCLDEERSQPTMWTKDSHRPDLAGQYHTVRELRIHSAEIPTDAHFFRIERFPIPLMVSEVVKEAMEKAGCLGAKFQEVT